MVCLQLFLRNCPHQTFSHDATRTQDYKQYTNTTNKEQTIKTDSKQYTAKEDLIAVCGRLCKAECVIIFHRGELFGGLTSTF